MSLQEKIMLCNIVFFLWCGILVDRVMFMKLVFVNEINYPVFRQFIHYYLNEIYDFTDGLTMDEFGNYEYEGIESYLSDPSLKAFLMVEDGKYIGFLMLNKGRYIPKGYDYSIHELFVAKPYRNKGYARMALEEIFTYYKGKYLVMQLEKNLNALRFWRHYYEQTEISIVEKRCQVDDTWVLMQTFLII